MTQRFERQLDRYTQLAQQGLPPAQSYSPVIPGMGMVSPHAAYGVTSFSAPSMVGSVSPYAGGVPPQQGVTTGSGANINPSDGQNGGDNMSKLLAKHGKFIGIFVAIVFIAIFGFLIFNRKKKNDDDDDDDDDNGGSNGDHAATAFRKGASSPPPPSTMPNAANQRGPSGGMPNASGGNPMVGGSTQRAPVPEIPQQSNARMPTMSQRDVQYPQPHIPPTGYPGQQRQAPAGYPQSQQNNALLQQMQAMAQQQQQQQQQGGAQQLVSANPSNNGANDPQFTALKV